MNYANSERANGLRSVSKEKTHKLYLLPSSLFVGFLMLDCSSIIEKVNTIAATLLVKIK